MRLLFALMSVSVRAGAMPSSVESITALLKDSLESLVAVRERSLRGLSTTSLLDSETTVTPLGCWGEGGKTALKPIGTIHTGWKTQSPVTCACLCRTAHGDMWDGLVGMGYEHTWSTCSCGVKGWMPFTYRARGQMESKCCPTYNPELGIIGQPPRGQISCPCPHQCRALKSGDLAAYERCTQKCDIARNVVFDPALKKSLKGEESHSWWAQSVFRVTLGAHCARETCPHPVPGQSGAPAETESERASWSKFELCPFPSGFAQDNQVCVYLIDRGHSCESCSQFDSLTPPAIFDCARCVR